MPGLYVCLLLRLRFYFEQYGPGIFLTHGANQLFVFWYLGLRTNLHFYGVQSKIVEVIFKLLQPEWQLKIYNR